MDLNWLIGPALQPGNDERYAEREDQDGSRSDQGIDHPLPAVDGLLCRHNRIKTAFCQRNYQQNQACNGG